MKAPAFLFEPAAWINSLSVRKMTPAQRGVYLDLLCCAWMDNGIHALDIERPWHLCKHLGIDYRTFRATWEVIKHKFVHRDGRYYNIRLESTREELPDRLKKRAIGVESLSGYCKNASDPPVCNQYATLSYAGVTDPKEGRKERKKERVDSRPHAGSGSATEGRDWDLDPMTNEDRAKLEAQLADPVTPEFMKAVIRRSLGANA